MRNMVRFVVRLLCVAAFLCLGSGGVWAQADVWDGTTIATQFAEGDGGEQTPYQIATAAQLAYLAQQVNLGNDEGGSDYSGQYFQLMNDIDLDNKEWTAIGIGKPFKGTFDGNKHTINNLRVKERPNMNDDQVGLFSTIDGATIKNLGVIISDEGINKATAECSTVGGIVGRTLSTNGGTITSCFVVGGKINAYRSGNEGFAGGIIGDAQGKVTISYCYIAVESITGIVPSGGSAGAGGIIGANQGNVTITNCLSLTPSYKSGYMNGYFKSGRIIGYGGSPTLKNNFSTPLYFVVGGNENKTSEKDLTKENFNADPGNALAGWEAAGWTLHDEQLPTLDSKAEGLPIDQFLVSGSGTSLEPYQVRNEIDLLYFAVQINQGASGYNGTEYYQLVKDLTLSSFDWTPIGTPDHPFQGNFDGNNKTITLGIKADAGLAKAGLFGTIKKGGIVKKLAVHVTGEGITAKGGTGIKAAGAIAAINSGEIDQCYVTGESSISAEGDKNANGSVGGIAGVNEGRISNCYNLISVKVGEVNPGYAGGIAGMNGGIIEYCFAAGEVSIPNQPDAVKAAAGGIVGFNNEEVPHDGKVSNCVAVNSKVNGTNAHRVIGAGADKNDVNNFSHHEMPIGITKATNNYDPLEGTALTKDNANGATGGCFNGWEAEAWNLDVIDTSMPKLKGFADEQHSLGIAPYLLYSVTIDAVTNGTLTVTRPGSITIGGSSITVNQGDQVPYNTELSITATPASGYELDQLTVGTKTVSSNTTTHQVIDNVTVSATFKEIPKYTVIINPPSNGTISITYTDPLNPTGTKITANNGEKVMRDIKLTITATPASGYELKALKVNGNNFANGTTHRVAGDVTVEATFEAESVDPGPIDPDPIEPDPTPTPPQPTVYYTVTLPSVEGAATDPVAGNYKVESWSSFRFYLTLDSAYNQSIPVVTTDRGDILTPRTSDGAYIVDYVRTDVEIYISDIVKNPDPVANEVVKANVAKVWKANGHLHLQSPVNAVAYIYTVGGNQHITCKLKAGEVKTIQLLPGVYFVRIGDESFKIAM